MPVGRRSKVSTSACLSSSRRTVCLPRLCKLVALDLRCASARAFAGAAFQEDVVGNDDGGAAVLLQDGEDVLEEVELFVACAAFAIFSPISVVEVEIADFQVPNPPC